MRVGATGRHAGQSKVKIPTPSTSLRAGSAAKYAARMGHPRGKIRVYWQVDTTPATDA